MQLFHSNSKACFTKCEFRIELGLFPSVQRTGVMHSAKTIPLVEETCKKSLGLDHLYLISCTPMQRNCEVVGLGAKRLRF